MQGSRKGMQTVWAIALGAAAFRLLLFLGLDLYADEAYYWMWSRRPATGYFDHPPMVAWLIRAGTELLPGELGVRILFLACGALAVVFAALIGRELSDDPRVPAVAAILAATSPMLLLTGGMALPDAPVEAAYAGGTWLVARARGKGWIPAGVVVGLALLSKYTAAILAPALILLVLLDRDLRRELATPWPWLGGAVAILVFLPNLLWNASNGWIAIVVQGRHGLGSGASLRSFLEYLGGLLGGAGLVALPLGVFRLVRGRDSFTIRVAAATLAPLLVTFLSALRGPVEANWGRAHLPGALRRRRRRAGPAAPGLVAGAPRRHRRPGDDLRGGIRPRGAQPRPSSPGLRGVRRFRGWGRVRRQGARRRGAHLQGGRRPGGLPARGPVRLPGQLPGGRRARVLRRLDPLRAGRRAPVPARPVGRPAPDRIGLPDDEQLSRGKTPVHRDGSGTHGLGRGPDEAPVAPPGRGAGLDGLAGALRRRVTDLDYMKDVRVR